MLIAWGSNFSPLENVALQTTAVAAGTMPLAGGFVGVIPALALMGEGRQAQDRLRSSNSSLLTTSFDVMNDGVSFNITEDSNPLCESAEHAVGIHVWHV